MLLIGSFVVLFAVLEIDLEKGAGHLVGTVEIPFNDSASASHEQFFFFFLYNYSCLVSYVALSRV